MNYIFYQTKTKFSNTGDALINKALIDVLRDYGTLRCNCSSDISDEFINELGINNDEKIISNSEISFTMSVLKQALKCVFKKDKVFLFSGLGHIYSDGKKNSKVLRNLLAGLVFPIYRIFGVKIIRIGFSIGPVSKGLAISEILRSIFISKYYVRDSKSLKLCHKIGIKKAKLCPDLSWVYLKDTERKLNNTNIITVNLKSSVLSECDQVYIESLISKCEEILKQINEIYDGNIKIKFIYQVADDKGFCIKLYEHFKDIYNSEYIDEQMMLSNAQEYYKEATFNISNRMHSLLLGYKYGTLPIALVDVKNHIKISQTFKDCNIDSLLVDVYDKDSKNVKNIINNKELEFNNLIKAESTKQQEIIMVLKSILK